MRRRSILAAIAALLAACTRPVNLSERETVFRTAEAEPWTAATRSLLTATDIETRKTGITLAAYADGALAAVGHFTTGLDAMALPLEPDRTYTLYALVNMGDLTGSLPHSESGLDELTYRIPSYTEGNGALAVRGIPMAGSLPWPSGGTVIPVKRLLAKVTAQLTCDWPEASIQSVKVRNLNRVLHPFGDASMDEDWDQQEFCDGTGTFSGTFVFYVPENRQGTIGGISTPEDKSPDRTPLVEARKENLTYLETSVSSTSSSHAGNITYRSYLGENATTDFDIVRNALYLWNIHYHADRTQDQDWKRDGDIFTVQVTADRTLAYVGETVRLTALRHRSDHGTVADTDVTKTVTWTRTGDAALRVDDGIVTASSPGTASFRASYTLDEWTAYGDSPTIIFRELPPLTTTWTAEATYVGQRGCFDVSGLVDGATIAEVISSDGSITEMAAASGTKVYVNYLGAGDATLTVKASNGQTGTIKVSSAAPHLLDKNSASGATAYYGHPDGTDVNTQPSGHGGLLPSFGYYTGNLVAVSDAMSVGDDPSPTKTHTGRVFAPDLYEAILKPVLTVDPSTRFGTGGDHRIWVQNLIDYPTEGGVAIGTLTASPVTAGRGILPLTETIFSVDPFAGVGGTVTQWPDLNDKGMLVQYVDCDTYDASIRVPGLSEVNADASTVGWDVKLAGAWNATLKALFSGNDNYLYFHYEEGDTLPHIGGLCEVQRTVTNPYSGERVGKTFLSFRVIVWGAVGGAVSLVNSSTFEVRPAYVGPSAAKPAGNIFRTTYADGEEVKIYGQSGNRTMNGTVHKDEVSHALGQAAYSVTLSSGDVLYKAQVYRSIHPCLTWPGYSDPWYRIESLEDIQTKNSHPDYHPGWVVDAGTPSDPGTPID